MCVHPFGQVNLIGAGFAVRPLAAAVGDASDFLHVQVHHVPGMLRGDRLDFPVRLRLIVRVDESAAVQAELGQVPGDCAPTDRNTVCMQFEGDAGRRPLMPAP